MSFKNPVGPPPERFDSQWLLQFWQWVTTRWFPKQRTLGDGLGYDADDHVEVTSAPTLDDGDYGDISVASGVMSIDAGVVGTTELADEAVTLAKMQHIGTGKLLGRNTAGTGDVEELTPVLDVIVADIQYSNRHMIGSAAASPPTLAQSDPTLSSATSANAWVAGALMTDGNVTWVAFRFAVPQEIDTTRDIQITATFLLNAATSGNVELTCSYGAFADNDANGTPSFSGTASKVVAISGYSAGDYVECAFSPAGIANYDSDTRFIQGVIERDATAGNADDTYADLILLMHVQFSGFERLA